ncbi:MAG TPA: NAD-dependent dehydratase [Clostridium sp.]|nr:NAD-dependent dehydratase [Clostridium sp.]
MGKYIVTGATGYIGTNIVKRLVDNGEEVYIIVRETSNLELLESIKDRVNIFIFDGNIQGLIEYFKPLKDAITIHLASLFIAEHSTDKVNDLIDSNIRFGSQLLEAMKEAGINKFINTGTSWQHYNNSEYNPVCLYAATKEAYEKIIVYYHEAYNIRNVTIELFDSYGPNDNRPKLLNLLTKYSVENKELAMSPGEQMLDLVYIDDIVDGYILASNMLEEGKIGNGEKFVLSSGCRITLKKLVEVFSEITNKKVKISWGMREYRKREVMIPWEKGKILPGWKPKISLKEGIVKSFK